ncbi:MAG TPA: hypothetical protein VGA89_02250 [Patescibacteria group bacterium]|jgi:hypothetical protein
MQKKKKIIAVIVLLVILIGGFLLVKARNDSSPSDETNQKRKLSLPTNTISVADRPYLAVRPQADGRNVELYLHDLKKSATTVEYELEYQAGTLLQGAFGSFEASNLPATEMILLGSCSAGGACTYHEDVKGGTLLTNYTGGDNPYALKSDWKYIDNTDRDTAHSSKDAKFQIDGKNLGQQRFIVIFNTPGYPEDLPGEAVSEIYSLETSGTLTGRAELTIRANEEGNLKIAAWDGSEWTTHEGEVTGKMITAEVELVGVYVVVR